MGKGIRRIKDASNEIKHEIHQSSKGLDSVGSEINEIHKVTQSVKRDVKKTLNK